MRELTFRGFLTQYVRQLSKQNTNSLYKLTAEASVENPRLREPLLLYALYSKKQRVLLQAARNAGIYDEYKTILDFYSAEKMTESLSACSMTIPEEYHKVWRTYQSQKNRSQADDHTKELMRAKIRRLQATYGITNYRIYTDLKLNPGNLNAWLKHAENNKVSLQTARMALRYAESTAEKIHGVDMTVR